MSRWASVILLAGLVVGAAGCDAPISAPTEGRVTDSPPDGMGKDGRKPAIVVDTPQEGTELTSPAVISGNANVFEATVSYRIVTNTGDVVAKGFTTATCGSGCRGKYSVTVPFKVDEPTEATLELFEESAEDGSPLHKVEIPVTLLP